MDITKYRLNQGEDLMKKVCFICKKGYDTKPSHFERRKTCSYNCMAEWYKTKLKGSGNPFYGKKHTETILKIFSDKKIGLMPHNYKGEIELKHCIVCNKELPRKDSLRNAKFCSWRCKGEYYSGEKAPNWSEDKNRIYPKEYIRIRKFILSRDNFTCKNCGSITNIVVHHIDYNKFNNDESNLITSCTRCNSLANFNKDYWKQFYSNILCKEAL